MSSAVADLEAGLQAMLGLKPPGVSGTRITSITTLCTANVQSEDVLIQKIYTHFKKAPGTHKLGVLYVVDSVTRKWTELAKNAGQPINSAAPDGTFAAGVNRVKELLPVLMNDIIISSPNDQKEKIKKLVDIWEKGQTFPLAMLSSFKEKLNAHGQDESTTPPGSPPSDLQNRLGLQPSMPKPAVASTGPGGSAAPNTSSILEALANMARQNTAPILPQQQLPTSQPLPQQRAQIQVQPVPQFQAPLQPQDNLYSVSTPAINHNLPFLPPFQQPVSVTAAPTPFASLPNGQSNGIPNYSNQANSFASAPAAVSATASLDPTVQQQLLLIKALSDQGFSPDKIAGIIAALGNGNGNPSVPAPSFGANQGQTSNGHAPNTWGAKSEESRDSNGHIGGSTRSPPNPYRRRSRSRSPSGWNSHDSPMRRREESNFEFDRDSPRAGARGDDRGRSRGRGNDYRQRSPPRRVHSPSTPNPPAPGNKWIGHDDSIPQSSIKVLSRTLFVGGVTSGTDHDLRQLFSRFGHVQTCIVNREKRHAFVKMVSRADAEQAKAAMERTKPSESSLRTRWGVGFGPRDCSDYATGVSIIPISKLTDADRKWMLNAEYGGSGGKPIEGGMVVEEPDIEIGQGVSSKAISRRMQTDKGGNNGPKSSRDRDRDRDRDLNSDNNYDPPRRGSAREPGKDEFGRDLREEDSGDKERTASISGPPSMPPVPPFGMLPAGFPFSLPSMPNGMPMFPPGFSFPGQQASPAQPPPPGRT